MEEGGGPEELGVTVALEKICALESRLRQAIQGTHSLHRSMGRDMGTVDREREALLLVREHLELLEDKLREFRTLAMDPMREDDKAVALSQLDGLRKDLLRAARDRLDFVLYNKDVVKEILAFADTGPADEKQAAGEADAPSGYTPPLSPLAPSDENEPFAANRDGSRSRGGSAKPAQAGGKEHALKEPAAFREGGHREAGGREAQLREGPAAREGALRGAGCRDAGLREAGARGGGPREAPFREELRLQLGESHEGGFPYPSIASTPSMRLPQGRDRSPLHLSHDAGRPRRSEHAPSSRAGGRPGSGAPSLASSYGYFTAPPSTAPPSEAGYEASYYNGRSTQPSEAGDPLRYGGTLSLAGYGRERAQPPAGEPGGGQQGAAAAASDRPRIVHDSSYADEQQAWQQAQEEEQQAAAAAAAAAVGGPMSPIRAARERRAAAQRAQAQQEREARGGRLLRLLGSTLHMALAGFVSAAAVVTVSSALQAERPAIAKAPARRRAAAPAAAAASPGRPRAEGQLVPDWMHGSRFQGSEEPPTGALTATAGPPRGHLFPHIPPPAGRHVRG